MQISMLILADEPAVVVTFPLVFYHLISIQRLNLLFTFDLVSLWAVCAYCACGISNRQNDIVSLYIKNNAISIAYWFSILSHLLLEVRCALKRENAALFVSQGECDANIGCVSSSPNNNLCWHLICKNVSKSSFTLIENGFCFSCSHYTMLNLLSSVY